MPLPILLIFDLDGTLLSGTSGRRAFRAAFAELCGLPDADQGVAFAGKTDTALFREVITTRGLQGLTPADVAPVYLRHLAAAVAQDPGRLLPGVPALLEQLAALPAVRLALGTGNMEAGARLKLAPHSIGHHFPTGGFATDAEVRSELIRHGIQKATAHYGTAFRRVVVIGDTPLDVACGQANGAATVAVATGPYPQEALHAAGADRVLPDFADVAAAVDALTTVAPRPTP